MSGGHPNLIIVEGLFFLFPKRKGEGFDKLSPNG